MVVQSDDYQFAIDQAPGKDLIAAYLATGEWSVLNRFLQVRIEWCGGYPLVHDRFVTYGAFDDLFSALSAEMQYPLIQPLLNMA